MYKVVELFAGAGGLALGLEKAGFKTLALIEKDKDAVKTLRKNRPDWNVCECDITEFSSRDLLKEFNLQSGELDLLSGGAPCQSFSYVGKKLGFEDTRGTLFYHFAMFLKKLKPKCFLFENVKGLKSHDNGKTFETICNVFKGIGYKIQFQVLNANNYEVAQLRERLITIGIREDIDINIDFPLPVEPKLVLKDILSKSLDGLSNNLGSKYPQKKIDLFKLIPQGGYWKNLPEDMAKEYMKKCYNKLGGSTGCLRRLSMEQPSLTIMTYPSQKLTERCHPLENRPLTVRESARCQSFPDDWEFVGSMGAQYRQVGNAVPVNLAYHIGLEIIKGLNQYI